MKLSKVKGKIDSDLDTWVETLVMPLEEKVTNGRVYYKSKNTDFEVWGMFQMTFKMNLI